MNEVNCTVQYWTNRRSGKGKAEGEGGKATPLLSTLGNYGSHPQLRVESRPGIRGAATNLQPEIKARSG